MRSKQECSGHASVRPAMKRRLRPIGGLPTDGSKASPSGVSFLARAILPILAIALGSVQLKAQSTPAPAPVPLPAPTPTPAPAHSAATLPATRRSSTNLVTNVFADTDLRQALQDIATQVGVTIIADPSVTGVVSCELKEVPLEKALGIILAGTGYAVQQTPDYYLVYPPDAKGVAFPTVSKTRRIRLNYTPAESVQKLLNGRFHDYVTVDPATNTVLITATESLMERITADVAAIDVPPRHVLLEARVVVLEHNDLLDLGVQWDFPRIRAGTFTNDEQNGSWPWGIQIGYTPDKTFTNSLLLTLNLLAQNQEARIAANPQVMAQDGRPAELSVSTDEYFQITNIGTTYTTAELEKIQTGTILKILPHIGDNSEVTLDMEIEVSDVIARGADGLPIVNRRTSKSTVRLQDGGTAAIAGLVDTRSQLLHSEVPFAGTLPLIGRLFQNDTNTQSSKQVAVFVTASLLEKPTSPPARSLVRRELILPVDAKEFRNALADTIKKLGKQTTGGHR